MLLSFIHCANHHIIGANMGIRVIERKDKKIIYADFRGVTDQAEMMRLLREAEETVKAITTPILLLVNCEGTFISQEFLERSQVIGKQLTEESILAKVAYLGTEGLKMILLQSYLAFTNSKTTRSFRTEAEAFGWLVAEENTLVENSK
jgi:hypothetical protein